MPCYGTLMVGQVRAGPLDRQTPVHHMLRPPLEASVDRPYPRGGADVGQAPSLRTGPPPLHSAPLADPARPASHATDPAPAEGPGTSRHPAPLAPKRGGERPRQQPLLSALHPALAEPLRCLLPLRLSCVTDAQEVALGNKFVARYHPVGYRRPGGPPRRCFLRDRQGRTLGCLRFDCAAPRLACRNQWIGWQDQKYHKH